MVRVFYEPPPGGPRTHLNRGGYYKESSFEPMFMKKLAKMRPAHVIFPALTAIGVLCYIPLSKYLKLSNPHHKLEKGLCGTNSDHDCFSFFSVRQGPSFHHERGTRCCPESLHALPQHEPHLRNLQQASSCFRPRSVNTEQASSR
jgi:hypothetical protein